MKKIKNYYKNMSIKYKIILMLYIAILPLLLMLIGYLYYTIQKSSKESLSTAYQEIARQTNETIHFIQTDIEEISTYICINENVKRVLNNGGTAQEFTNVWRNDSSMNFFMDIVGSKSYISFIALYANNGVEPYYITTDTSVLIDDINKIMDTRYYKKASNAKGAPKWHYIDKENRSLFENNKSHKIIMNRVIINHMEVKNIGYLMVGINENYIEKMLTSMESLGEGIIIKEEDEILLKKGDIKNKIEKYIMSETMKEDIGKQELGVIYYEGSMIYFSKSSNKQSEVYYIVSERIMEQRYGTAKYVATFLMLGALILLLPTSYLLSGHIVKPLKRITDSMQKFKKGDFTQWVEYNNLDEIGEVAKCYNDMVKHIKELIDTKYLLEIREKESELSSLQAQINPHFLYNTLDSIYWKALEDKNNDIAEMVYSLARIFRLSLNRGKSFTTVEKEIELVGHYLNIQKMRFEDKLKYTISVDESLKNYIVPKLLLQPFVENGIIHGIEQEGKGGILKVIATREEDCMCFVIEDSGKGMTNDQVVGLFEKPKGDVNINKVPGGYAINNVFERLKLKYKEEFSLIIESQIHEGTRVIMKLPYTINLEGDH